MPKPKKKKVGGAQGELMQALNVTMADVHANENGHLTKRQHRQLRQYRQRRERLYAWLALAATLAATFWLTANILLAGLSENLFTVVAINLALSSATAAAGWFAAHRHLLRKTARNRVETVRGVVIAHVNQNRLKVNNRQLNTSSDVLRRVRHLEPYVVHYHPDSRRVLSMVPLESETSIRPEYRAAFSRPEATPAVDSDTIEAYDEDDMASQRTQSS